MPQCIAAKEREIKTDLQKEIFKFLENVGHRINRTVITFFITFGYQPEYHLRYRVFLNQLLGYSAPGGKAHSFVIPLNGSSIEGHIKTGMKKVPPPPRVEDRLAVNNKAGSLGPKSQIPESLLQSLKRKAQPQETT